MKQLLVFFLLLSVFGQTALAQVDSASFNIRIFAGEDTEAPTTPTLSSVVPITSNQIDIAWTAATDNFSVAGYVLSRDSVDIATTTLLTYSDTGLTASTTYSYQVRAFDVSNNYSSSSNSLATTTPDVPVVPPVATTSDNSATESTAARVIITDLHLELGYSTTSIWLTTKRPSRFELRWGRTDSYEMGYIVTNAYARNHQINLTDLEPGTKYYYEIVGYAESGFESVVRTGSFTTLTPAVNLSPANVNRFTAVRSGTDANLSWQLPTGTDISQVRIVRSHLGWPQSPNDGAVIYQGLGTAVIDINILKQYSPVYYTAFVYDKFGNVSSGAVAIVYALFEDNTNSEEVYEGSESIVDIPVFAPEATSTINQDRVTPDMKMPNPSDILVRQGDEVHSLFDTNIKLDSNKDIIISIPSSVITKNLKSIIVSIIDPTNNREAYSYLLKINKDFTAYETTISPLGVIGKSNLVVQIYDYEAFILGTYQTPIVFITTDQGTVVEPTPIFPDLIYKYASCLFYFLIIILILLLALLFYRRETEDKE